MQFNLYESRQIHAVWPLDVELDIEDRGKEFYDKNTFINLNSPHIEARWNHLPETKFASVEDATMTCFLTAGKVHVIFYFDAGNENSQKVFQKVSELGYVGLSPGFKDLKKDDRRGDHHVKGVLKEWSLTPQPAHGGSYASLDGELSMQQIGKQMNDHWRWLNEQKSLIDKKAATDSERYRATSEKFWKYLNEQKGIASAVSDGDIWTKEKVAQFMKNHPRFQRSERRGYETALR